MRVIIAGSRGFNDLIKMSAFIDHLHSLYHISQVISGTANGADILGEQWAIMHNIPVVSMPADWQTHGKSAGYIRNEQMAEIADYVVCFWDGVSRGTKHMIETARRKSLPLWIIYY